MERELSYLNSEGFTIFTSYFHKKRGYCCQSLCLHCPYGLTAREVGFVLTLIEGKDLPVFLASLGDELSRKCADQEVQEIYSVSLKGYSCGVVIKDRLGKKLILGEKFKDQGITLEMVEKEMKGPQGD